MGKVAKNAKKSYGIHFIPPGHRFYFPFKKDLKGFSREVRNNVMEVLQNISPESTTQNQIALTNATNIDSSFLDTNNNISDSNSNEGFDQSDFFCIISPSSDEESMDQFTMEVIGNMDEIQNELHFSQDSDLLFIEDFGEDLLFIEDFGEDLAKENMTKDEQVLETKNDNPMDNDISNESDTIELDPEYNPFFFMFMNSNSNGNDSKQGCEDNFWTRK